MKNSLLTLIALGFSLSLSAQVGINTDTPSSTLETKGSVEANFNEVTTSTYTILATDYHISYSGVNAANFTLPTASLNNSTINDYRGRKYFIKNNSTSAITLAAASGQNIRFGGSATSQNTYVIKPGNYATITASAGAWDLDLVAATADTNNWVLYGTDLNGKINTFQQISSGTTYQAATGGVITITVPTGYSQNKIALNFTGWGHAITSGSNRGSLRFRITQTGQASTTYNNVMMSSWATPNATNNGIRFNFPITYSLDNLAAGTYTFTIEVIREDESSTLANTAIGIWGIQSRADIFVKE